jgi:hypothetical protein
VVLSPDLVLLLLQLLPLQLLLLLLWFCY